MKQLLFTLVFMCFLGSSFAQLNMSLQSQVDYNVNLNDIWGWKDEVSGIEYALVGLTTGVSIVSLEDPTNATEVQFIPGASSTWRDLKTWKDHLYVSNETGDGLMVIDLSQLPDAAPAYNWQPNLPELGGTLDQIHNLYVDEGVLYIAGSNLNNGGNLIVDVDTDPSNPVYLGASPAIYAHDVYVRDNIMYSSEIYLGSMTIYDLSNLDSIQLLGSQTTPFEFTHNIWLSDDSSVAFTTDERANAPVAAYDISDFSNIVELDQYAPIETLGEGVIPHNVHVWNDWLVISYYSDGGIIVDASRPENLIEVGNFDTFFGAGAGFSGAWGLYPFLPSGLVLVSSIGDGLFVLDANYVRACWLEGTVTDAVTGETLAGVDISIDSDQANMGTSEANGFYETGQAIPGSFEVTYEKAGYEPKTITTTLENGIVTIEDVELQPFVNYTLSGTVANIADGTPIPNANISILGNILDYSVNSDANGNFSISVLGGDYDIFVGAWGYHQAFLSGENIAGDNTISIPLVEGYEDDFALDLGWVSTNDADATSGFWERGEPMGTTTNGNISNPEFDLTNDLGDKAYVTGNAGGGVGDDDVDGGNVVLTSPVMDLSGYVNPILDYSYWFFNAGGNSTPNDQLEVRISNGTDVVILETITTSQSAWNPSTFELANMIDLTDNMTISFETGDQPQPNGHLVEAGVDGFSVTDVPLSVEQVDASALAMTAFPNPFKEKMTLNFDLSTFENKVQVNIYNALGQLVQQFPLTNVQTSIEVGENLNKGVYFVELLSDDKVSQSLRIVKQ